DDLASVALDEPEDECDGACKI
ncbi:hypothetical protein ACWWKA_32655, partial [Klebsiella quasipneumoniae]